MTDATEPKHRTRSERATCSVCGQDIYRRPGRRWQHRLDGLPYSPWVRSHYAAPAEL